MAVDAILMADFGKAVFLFAPLVVSGTLNMIFVKSSWFNALRTPIDQAYVCKNGIRLLGENKTWKGFWGMCFLSAISVWIFEVLAKQIDIINSISLIPYRSFTLPFNGLFWGFAIGLCYVIFELPNSYIKRRLNIAPGKNVSGFKGLMFTIADQADSIIGVTICFAIIFPIDTNHFFQVIAAGTMLHLLVNVFLYNVGLKKQWR